MSLIFSNKYPGRWLIPTAEYPQGSGKNRTTPTSNDGSYFEKEWVDDLLGFPSAILNAAGVTPNNTKDTGLSSQVFDALLTLLPPVGSPQPWPTDTAPDGWLECNGQSFNLSSFPRLALAYPSGTLPDLRGRFIRGWNHDAILDPGRGILTDQGDATRNVTGSFRSVYATNALAEGAFSITEFGNSPAAIGTVGADPGANYSVSFDMSSEVPTANEVRPVNTAFMYIVRAL